MHLEPNAGYLWLIPLFPLIGAALNLLVVGRRLPKGGDPASGWLAVAFMLPAFILGVYAFSQILGMDPSQRYLLDHRWTIVSVGAFQVNMAFWVDQLSGVMLLVVTGVGTLIHIYAVGYMAHDHYGSNWRFFGYLNLFIFFMLLLILADNFILMFFGWEGVGLCSYLLISYYYRETTLGGDPPALPPAPSGAKAFIVNRVGDFAFLVGLFCLFWGLAGSWDSGSYLALEGGQLTVTFREIEALLGDEAVRERLLDETFLGMSLITAVGVFMFIGAAGKSAQIPLYIWLPDAMAGPTPVSALIHAATMVTSGVYMIARLNYVYALSPTAMTVVASVGALTAIFAATIGLFQWDIKKVLAYSTVSQLGFMFLGVGVGAFAAAIFHVVTHAFFKACLFLGSGSVIHGMHHEQDMRQMGGLRKYMPKTFWTYVLATVAIAGVPLTAGFFSKDQILEAAFIQHITYVPGWLLWFVGLVAAGGTSFYMWRTVGMTFSGELRRKDDHGQGDDHGGEHGSHEPHESPITMTGVLMVLAALSILAGFLGVPHAFGGHNNFIEFLKPIQPDWALAALGGEHHPSDGLVWGLTGITVLVGLGGIFLAHRMYWGKPLKEEWLKRLSPRAYELIFHKYKIDELYENAIQEPLLKLCSSVSRFDNNVVDGGVNLVGAIVRLAGQIDAWIDHHIVDGAVNGTADLVVAGSRQIRSLQTGRIQHYAYGLIAGIVALVAFYQFI